MSDPVAEEDDLISQDDIDKLLDMGDDDAGELSQDDIDSLLNGPSPDEDAAGELSQDDIDRMMAGSAPEPEAAAEEEDAGELSQDDIDRMMSGNTLGGDDDQEDEDLELISQDDIDRLMNDSSDEDPDDDDDEMISLEDIQSVMVDDDKGDNTPDAAESDPGPDTGTMESADTPEDIGASPEQMETESVQEEPEQEEPEQTEPEQTDDGTAGSEAEEVPYDPWDEPIDEGQAMDVSDCMIAQETMDALIEAGVISPDTPAEDAGGEPEPADSGDEDLSSNDDLLDGLDLMSATDDAEDDVTQEDIDALLQGGDEEDDFLDEDEDILISQDDIDTLLMAADQEDEDVLGDLSGEDDDTSEPRDALDDELEAEDSDQVVLEGIEGAEIPERDDRKPKGPSAGKRIKALLRSKVMLAAASVLLFMGISVPISYFLFFSSDPVPLPEKQSGSLTDIDLGRDVPLARSGLEDTVMPATRRSGTILLPNFIILASDQSKTMTYVYADVSIDYSDQRAYDEISNNLAFYRDLIYGAIQARLVSEKNNEVTKADLLWDVETSLKKVLPPHYFDRITFKTFKAT